jgi:hypothetical protein
MKAVNMRMKLATLVLAAASVVGGCATPAPTAGAGDLRVTVRADETGLAVNPAVTRGYNFGNWMAMVDHGEALSRTPAASLRFPGGNIGDEQDMDAATLNAFRALLTMVKGNPGLVIQTRVFSNRVDRPAANGPEDAANAVRMARERGLKVRHWEIGNEPDLYSVTRGDPSWTPERYCEVFRAQAKAVKAADPKALVAGPATSGAHPKAMRFLDRFVELCGDAVDVLSWHIYPTEGEGTDDAALATVSQVDASIRHVRTLLRDPRRNPLGHTRDVPLAVTEYGLSWKTDRPRFLSDMPAGLWAAEAALRMAEQGMDMAHYFAYQGTVFHGLLDNAGVPRPTYYAFRLLDGLSGRFVAVDSSDPKLWSHAVRDGETLQVLLLNTQSAPVNVALDAAGWRAREVKYFDAGIVDEEADFASLPAGRRLTLPSRSMAVVRLQRAP